MGEGWGKRWGRVDERWERMGKEVGKSGWKVGKGWDGVGERWDNGVKDIGKEDGMECHSGRTQGMGKYRLRNTGT